MLFRSSIDGQGEWGGNLDIRDVTVGNKIFLPVHQAGGLFYLGDVHASQGDTEFTGTAAEVTERIASEGADFVGNTPEEYLAFLKAEHARWSKVVREANIRVE